MSAAPRQQPPCRAVPFTSVTTGNDQDDAETAERLVALAADQPVFPGLQSVRVEREEHS